MRTKSGRGEGKRKRKGGNRTGKRKENSMKRGSEGEGWRKRWRRESGESDRGRGWRGWERGREWWKWER